MSFLVTRPDAPVPSSCEMSMPCSRAMLRTSGLDLVRRNSSTVCAPPAPRGCAPELCVCAPCGTAGAAGCARLKFLRNRVFEIVADRTIGDFSRLVAELAVLDDG